MNFFTLTFRALGRNHIASTSLSDHRNAMFKLDSQIPLVRTSSKLIVNCSKRRSTRDLPRPSTTRHASSPPSRASPTKQSTSTPAASDQGPHYPTLRANPYPEVTDLFCRLPLSTLFYQLEAVHLGDLLRLSVRPGMKTIPSCGFSRAVTSAPEPAKVLASSSHKTPSPDKPIPG